MKAGTVKRVGRVSAVLVTAALCLSTASVAGERSMRRFIEKQMRKANVPGLSASLVAGGEVVWSQGYGWAEVESSTPATPDTLYLIASVSKLVTTVGVMVLNEEGLLDLDEDVNAYLPFSVRNPAHPERPITVRQLLTHTSSISDLRFVELFDAMFTPGDWPETVTQFAAGYLVDGGRYYRPEASFSAAAPGERFEYTNVGFSLLGAVAEAVTGGSFESFQQERVLGPLAMHRSGWSLSVLAGEPIAVPYSWAEGRYEPYPHYGTGIIPAAQLRTSSAQLGRFVAMLQQLGRLDGERLLAPASIKEMVRVQFPELAPAQGLGFTVFEDGGFTYAAHGGALLGASSDLRLELETGTGVVLLTNGEPYLVQAEPALRAMAKIRGRLLKKGRKMARQ